MTKRLCSQTFFSEFMCDSKDLDILLVPGLADGPLCKTTKSNAFLLQTGRDCGTVGMAGPSTTESSRRFSMLLHRLNLQKQRSVFSPHWPKVSNLSSDHVHFWKRLLLFRGMVLHSAANQVDRRPVLKRLPVFHFELSRRTAAESISLAAQEVDGVDAVRMGC
jgi:hypothetical protein